jgi:hypothetical protein
MVPFYHVPEATSAKVMSVMFMPSAMVKVSMIVGVDDCVTHAQRFSKVTDQQTVFEDVRVFLESRVDPVLFVLRHIYVRNGPLWEKVCAKACLDISGHFVRIIVQPGIRRHWRCRRWTSRSSLTLLGNIPFLLLLTRRVGCVVVLSVYFMLVALSVSVMLVVLVRWMIP